MIVNSTTIDAVGSISSFGGAALYGNEITDGILGFGIVLIVAATLFIALKSTGRDGYESIAASMFVATVVAIILRFVSATSVITGQTISLVGDKTMWGCIVILAMLIAGKKMTD